MTQRVVAFVLAATLLGCSVPAPGLASNTHRSTLAFRVESGGYTIAFSVASGVITVARAGTKPHLALREMGVDPKLDLLHSVTSIHRAGSTYTLSGHASWASFVFHLDFRSTTPGLMHLTLSVKPSRDVPQASRAHPDVQLVGASSSSLHLYDAAPPIAGTSLFLSNQAMKSSILYLANLTTLGQYFDRTQTGAAQPLFSYPRAGGKGALVGIDGSYFGYELPADNLPHGKSTLVIDSYLYLLPGVPSDETSMSDTYLKLLSGVYSALPKPALPAADWHTLAAKASTDLA
ncbi:MAG TPA: hypothetical protein VF221_13215, partial [Chloroflexota bacterium]